MSDEREGVPFYTRMQEHGDEQGMDRLAGRRSFGLGLERVGLGRARAWPDPTRPCGLPAFDAPLLSLLDAAALSPLRLLPRPYSANVLSRRPTSSAAALHHGPKAVSGNGIQHLWVPPVSGATKAVATSCVEVTP